jgi:6-phosphogluconate dehydrogenase
MKLGIIGLGRMGLAIAQRAVQGGHEVIGFDFSAQATETAQKSGVSIVTSMPEVAQKARIIWLMVPAGDTVDEVIEQILPNLQTGDIVIDGGNSKFTDSIRRYHVLGNENVHFLDCGTSGGLRGRDVGFSLMIGGDESAYTNLIPLFTAIAAPQGFCHVGPAGSGHYVKMVHNGIEYGLMQAYAEGFHLIKDGSFQEHNLDLAKISNVWMHGSVIRSFLLELAHEIFVADQELTDVSGKVDESGMGKWTVEDAEQLKIPLSVIQKSLDIRAQSQKTGGNYATKIVALLRKSFGGHSIHKATK